MMNNLLLIKKGCLFENAPKGSILLHSCNCRGVWGSGIAKTFYEKFPEAFKEYNKHCHLSYPDDLLGTCLIIKDKDYTIACLFTSDDYGDRIDLQEQILENTSKALWDLRKQLDLSKEIIIDAPKINSGLFNTPWELTEKVIYGNSHNNMKWTIWEVSK